MSRTTPIGDIIKGIEGPDAFFTVDDIARHRNTPRISDALYGKILMACEGDQLKFLVNLYDHFVPDDDVLLGFLALIKSGFFPELLDVRSSKAKDLLQAVQFCITQSRVRAVESNERSSPARGRSSRRR